MSEEDLYFWYKGMYMPKGLYDKNVMTRLENFIFRPDDIIIATYPKSGTSWLKEIIPLIITDGDITSVESSYSWDRVPWLEMTVNDTDLSKMPSPRVLATHLPYHLMPASFFEAKPKVICAMRNPKDVFTSLLHYSKAAQFMVNPGPQREFLNKFLDGKVIRGSWFDHVKTWLNVPDKSGIMYIYYEDMVADLKHSVTRIAKFLDKSLDTAVIEKITDKCLFKNMKENNKSNYTALPKEMWDQTKSDFLRKGICGDWKNQMTVEESEYFDAVYKFKLKDVQIKFPWD